MKYFCSYGLEDRFEFGKYKDRRLKAIIDTDVIYIRWCFENIEGFSIDSEALKFYEKTLIRDGHK